MDKCSYCGVETTLSSNGVPTCIPCDIKQQKQHLEGGASKNKDEGPKAPKSLDK